ncbi:MAG: hypothetical protein KatS3mg115_1431 [Candidatus Poribacteria bacterium]|nr:MAG: hypothetical protein KatS3mg115_1431 [Candidatus Poribacteria bacterium]
MSFPKTRPRRGSIVRPAEGAEVDINPPGFNWWRAEGAAGYRFFLEGETGEEVHRSPWLSDPVYVPDRAFPAGVYRWRVEGPRSGGPNAGHVGADGLSAFAERS